VGDVAERSRRLLHGWERHASPVDRRLPDQGGSGCRPPPPPACRRSRDRRTAAGRAPRPVPAGVHRAAAARTTSGGSGDAMSRYTPRTRTTSVVPGVGSSVIESRRRRRRARPAARSGIHTPAPPASAIGSICASTFVAVARVARGCCQGPSAVSTGAADRRR
jgi:hypothetical protein